mmetsp:Transcript_6476/g.11146  ORF Transcript_6476/g.11146 Transcript_6476/m.11146 type:complete len:289 (+) Transcript_6476:94-960(+)
MAKHKKKKSDKKKSDKNREEKEKQGTTKEAADEALAGTIKIESTDDPDTGNSHDHEQRQLHKEEDLENSRGNRKRSDSGDTSEKRRKKRRTTSIASLSEFLPDCKDNPVFFRKRVQFTISLLPWSMRNCEQAVKSSIRKMLLRYSDGLGGILLAYDDVKLQDPRNDDNSKGRGWILNELPYIHYEVTCRALVFSPSLGCELQGVVNGCFHSHIGILVMGNINAMVSAENMRRAGYKYDSELSQWTVGDDGYQTITNGSKIRFIVTKIHECEGTISIVGACPPGSSLIM